jgi:hypothetical protein
MHGMRPLHFLPAAWQTDLGVAFQAFHWFNPPPPECANRPEIPSVYLFNQRSLLLGAYAHTGRGGIGLYLYNDSTCMHIFHVCS